MPLGDTHRILELEQQMLRLVKATEELNRKQLSSIRGLEAKVYELQHVVSVMVKVLRPEVAVAHLLPPEEPPCH